MDLISIKRKYRNIRNIIIVVFIAIMLILIGVIIREKHLDVKYEKIYLSYKKLIEQSEN